MKSAGIALMVVGAMAAAYAMLGYNTSFQSDILPIGGMLDPGLLQRQTMLFQAGLVGFLGGAILLAAGALIEADAGTGRTGGEED